MKREYGYRIIDNYKKIRREFYGDYCVGWYEDNNILYLFKEEDVLMSYRELFYPFVLKKLKMSSVKNDLAKRVKCRGIISENYTTDKQNIRNMLNIVEDYYDNNYELEEWPDYLKWFKRWSSMVR